MGCIEAARAGQISSGGQAGPLKRSRCKAVAESRLPRRYWSTRRMRSARRARRHDLIREGASHGGGWAFYSGLPDRALPGSSSGSVDQAPAPSPRRRSSRPRRRPCGEAGRALVDPVRIAREEMNPALLEKALGRRSRRGTEFAEEAPRRDLHERPGLHQRLRAGASRAAARRCAPGGSRSAPARDRAGS